MERTLSHFFTAPIAQKAGYMIETGYLYHAPLDPLVTGLAYDSREVEQGNIFFALAGIHHDGHAFVPDAIKRGASVIIHQNELDFYHPDIVYIKVKDSRAAMSPVAAAFYGFPSKHLSVVGVTGTEGKSTTVYLIYQLLKLSGKAAGFLSTVQFNHGGGEQWNRKHETTPEAASVHKALSLMRDNGLEYAVIEASSHGLSAKTNRLGDVAFDAAVLTNVNREHLEFHETWEQYRYDKANLFRALDAFSHEKALSKEAAGKAAVPSFAVVNLDDPSAAYFSEATRHIVYTYSVRGRNADLKLEKAASSQTGNWYELSVRSKSRNPEEVIDLRDRLPGAFNAGNVLASLLTVSQLLLVPIKSLAPLVPLLKPVLGRMTRLVRGQPFEVLVDFAHTPSSFQAVFPPLRERIGRGRIISLFGSAGDRDTSKRGEQGRIAAEWSDIVILTDEDPRGEAPLAILEEIASGIPSGKRGEDLFLIPNRPAAVRTAFVMAKKGDLVILLGKGHENSIIYAGEVRPYNEIDEAEKALAELGYIGGSPRLSV
ncbi:MAG: UDP-N-acetylmuramoyl-L-alanyl-D-glutamate--2,6-diaminopimelate ligase [Spirochaetaceae bacterium]|jgi:UDP-N-acetylmuramoyl-L-alanyl-D-glutamate--2,6-diaminopimelate ligase|nr:UDP-N-acetylmuramoyl-L-alanyl-D-glutamate--2,6-diaminopimelate ligase [Spirochaetaceae bacterium]